MKFTIDDKSARDFGDWLQNSIDDLVEYYADALADYILQKAQEYLENGPLENSRNPYGGATDTGELVNSGFIIGGEGRRTIEFIAEHASYIEYGTSPHMPPVEPLIRWAKRNKMKNPKAAAWAIAKRIAKEGTPPKPFLRQALEAARSNARLIAEEAVAEYLSSL